MLSRPFNPGIAGVDVHLRRPGCHITGTQMRPCAESTCRAPTSVTSLHKGRKQSLRPTSCLNKASTFSSLPVLMEPETSNRLEEKHPRGQQGWPKAASASPSCLCTAKFNRAADARARAGASALHVTRGLCPSWGLSLTGRAARVGSGRLKGRPASTCRPGCPPPCTSAARC